ncbi:hypothetical protein [Streptomyces carpinensis]|uniref:Uncharacterized protein n=1 Tax=Streptomyces carpinensis TaxID=66369 RepID=A0ABV1VZF4_9ACTN|nr:hypothetical protein [Streptomyces carpinensis]
MAEPAEPVESAPSAPPFGLIAIGRIEDDLYPPSSGVPLFRAETCDALPGADGLPTRATA